MPPLLSTAYEYTNCYTSAPSDSFPGIVAQLTGGTPKTMGIWYDDTCDSTSYNPGSNCTGAAGANVFYHETITPPKIFSGGIYIANLAKTLGNGVFPHKRMRVNTIYEVVRSQKVETALYRQVFRPMT